MPAILHLLSGALDRVGHTAFDTFFLFNSTFSLASLASALVIAAFAIVFARLRRRGRIGFRLLGRALAPRRAAIGASGKADLGFFFFNTFSAGGLIGWGLLSQTQVSDWTARALIGAFGRSEAHASGPLAAGLTTLALFLAYELAYWVDHWLSHNVPALWEIHKVHHTAEALSPLTNFRVHPLETLKFYNVAALLTGAANGALVYGLGPQRGHLSLYGVDAAIFIYMFTIAHLQHSHVWISFDGWLGRLVLSPAHHQIHHSTDERHFGSNLGSALAIWDWLFGTLYVPAARREPLSFGVAGATAAAHTVTGTLITPVTEAGRALARSFGRPRAGYSAEALSIRSGGSLSAGVNPNTRP
jgi:sterol desaturase/sphingolipid hydroxylase (fatty acid hydroxylase superfamily)